MDTTSRELIALRDYLVAALDPADVTRINMRTITQAAEAALSRGWPGKSLAANAVAGVYSGGIDNPGAYITANLRDLGTIDPPVEVTPTPPPVQDVLADVHGRNQPSANPQAWIARIRQGAQ
jgi:hypothetical protein